MFLFQVCREDVVGIRAFISSALLSLSAEALVYMILVDWDIGMRHFTPSEAISRVSGLFTVSYLHPIVLNRAQQQQLVSHSSGRGAAHFLLVRLQISVIYISQAALVHTAQQDSSLPTSAISTAVRRRWTVLAQESIIFACEVLVVSPVNRICKILQMFVFPKAVRLHSVDCHKSSVTKATLAPPTI